MVEMAKFEGIEVHVLAPMYDHDEKSLEIMDEGIHVHFFDPHVYPDKDPLLTRIFPGIRGKFNMLRFLLSFRKRGKQIIQKHGIDIVHSHWLIPSGLVGYLLNPPILVNTSYGSDIMILPKKRMWRVLIKHILRKVDFQYAIGDVIREKSLGLGARHAETIMPVPVDSDQFKQLMKVPLTKHEEEEVNIVTVASLYPLKNISALIQSVKILGKMDGVTVHIVGDGDLREELEQKSHSSEIPIVFHGFLDRESTLKIISESHISVLPSYSEGLSSFLVESLLAGNLILASNVGGTPTMVNNADLLFEPDEIERLASLLQKYIANGDQRLRIVEEKRNTEASNFNPKELVAKIVSKYNEIR